MSAKTVNNDFQNWSIIMLNKEFSDKWGASFEVQNRLGNNLMHEGIFFIRPSIHYKLNDHFTLTQGYAWTPSFQSGFVNENRLWEQIGYKTKLGKVDVFAWNRLEERFIEGVGGASLRDRTRLGAKIPMFKLKTWKFVTWDEFFVNLNTLDNGPRGGFDQNWIFTRVEKQISENTTLEAGYLMNYLNRDPGQLQHALSLNLNINF